MHENLQNLLNSFTQKNKLEIMKSYSQGVPGLQGLPGVKGPPGDQGISGNPGRDGQWGSKGEKVL